MFFGCERAIEEGAFTETAARCISGAFGNLSRTSSKAASAPAFLAAEQNRALSTQWRSLTANGPVAISAMVVHTGLAIEDPRDVRSFDLSKSALFVFCGAGVGCAIPDPPSTGLAALLDREVVALTLRTLDKLQSVDSVLTFLPPSSAKRVVYLTRGDLAQQLSEPLLRALSRRRALTALVHAHTFAVSSISPLPDGSAYLAAAPGG